MADEIGLGSESDGNESPGANLFRAGSKKTYGLANSEDVTDRGITEFRIFLWSPRFHPIFLV